MSAAEPMQSGGGFTATKPSGREHDMRRPESGQSDAHLRQAILGAIRRDSLSPLGVHVELPQHRTDFARDRTADTRSPQELAEEIERTIHDMSRRIDVLARHFNLSSHFDGDTPGSPRAA